MKLEKWVIPKDVISDTVNNFLTGEHEVFVLWTSKLQTDTSSCNIVRSIMPDQRPGFTPYGAYVHIEGFELSRIQFENYKLGQRSVVQLHTHPSSDVRMSELDLKWEVISHVGGLSIIVPDYGKRGLIGFPGVNVYEREKKGWRLWSRQELNSRLEVLT